MKPLLIVEPDVVNVVSQQTNIYDVCVRPKNGVLQDIDQRQVTLWPTQSIESRTKMRALAEKIADQASEVKIVMPDGKPDGWNIATAIAAGESWAALTEWARGHNIPYVKLHVEVTQPPDPVPESAALAWEQLGLARDAHKNPVMNADNVVRIFEGWAPFKEMVWYDSFYQIYFLDKKNPRPWTDADTTSFTIMLQRNFGMLKMSEAHVFSGMIHYGKLHARNEPKEWIHSLKWDGKERIDRFFVDYLGTIDGAYAYAVSRNFWIGIIARIYNPGCMLRNMVILEGKQEAGKSTALAIIGGKWYMEAGTAITLKDFFVDLQGKLIVEISELDSFSKTDNSKIKRVISCKTDRYRAPYAKISEDHPRQCVFVGSTNEEHYLKDFTGGTRFWPIKCGSINLQTLREDRAQLFAEARTRYLTGEDWYKVPEEDTRTQQEARLQFDEWESILGLHLQTLNPKEISMQEAGKICGLDTGELVEQNQRRIGKILRRLGWFNNPVWKNGVQIRLWHPVTQSL